MFVHIGGNSRREARLMYVCIYLYTHTYIYIYIHTYIYVCLHALVCRSLQAQPYAAQTPNTKRIHKNTDSDTHIGTYIHIWMSSIFIILAYRDLIAQHRPKVCIHTHKYIYTCTYYVQYIHAYHLFYNSSVWLTQFPSHSAYICIHAYHLFYNSSL